MAVSDEQLTELVKRIVDTVDPLRVILFGSTARGQARSDSDLDVLVVVPDGAHRRRTAQKIYRGLLGFGIPVDVVVATHSDLQMYSDSPGLIYKEAIREGVELYAA